MTLKTLRPRHRVAYNVCVCVTDGKSYFTTTHHVFFRCWLRVKSDFRFHILPRQHPTVPPAWIVTPTTRNAGKPMQIQSIQK